MGITEEETLQEVERQITEIAASEMEFVPPPYDLAQLRQIHYQLFLDLYEWAGEIRSIDLSKGNTRFCHAARIEPEANKIFRSLAQLNWLEGLGREALVPKAAEFYGELNMLHPFREGNGRAQRLLFEHMIINAGFEISWGGIDRDEWIEANVAAVGVDYRGLIAIFERSVGDRLPP